MRKKVFWTAAAIVILFGAGAAVWLLGLQNSIQNTALVFADKEAVSVSVIGGADGPTSIFLAGRIGGPESTGYWLFLTICSILTPLLMIIFGRKLHQWADRESNAAYGYRTKLSIKNQETWQFANHYCGGLWKKEGLLMLIITVLVCAVTYLFSNSVRSVVCLLLVIVQMLLLALSVLPVEKALKNSFDEEGNRHG